jgi:copper homeostasis protein
MEGAGLIAGLIKQADSRIIIMPGSGVRAGNIIELAKLTGATEFHSSARMMRDTGMQYINQSMNEKLKSITVDREDVERMLALLTEHFSD